MIKEFFNRPEVNTGRQDNLDLLKGIAIIFTILCHPFLRLGSTRPGFGSELGFIIGCYGLGQYALVAHGFMLAMGIGIIYTKKSGPKELFIRGIKTYLLGYVLNFCRYGVYILAEGIITGSMRDEFAYAMYAQDIFQFAGLAMMLTALFKKLHLKEEIIFLISLCMSAFGALVAFTETGSTAGDVLLGHLIVTTKQESIFVLCNWYIYVATGLLFGKILQRVRDLNGFYKKLILISGLTMGVYIFLSVKLGMFFASKKNWYFCASPVDAFGLISIDLFVLCLCYFILKAVKKEKLNFLFIMGRHITKMFFIHWCFLGPINCLFSYVLGVQFSYPAILGIGVGLVIVTYWIVKLGWCRKKQPVGAV